MLNSSRLRDTPSTTAQDENSELIAQNNSLSVDGNGATSLPPSQRKNNVEDISCKKNICFRKERMISEEDKTHADCDNLIADTSGGKLPAKTKICEENIVIQHQPNNGKDDKKGVRSKNGATSSERPELLSIPQTNFAIGLLVTCCFNLPFGLLAVYFSLRAAAAYRDGDKSRGAWRARTSIVLSLVGIMLTMVIISSAVLYIAVNKHSAKRGLRRTGSTSLGF